VHSAQDLVLRDPAHGWTVDELADRAHTSPRNLGRLFRRHAGISPQAYVRKIRTAAARELLAQPDLNLDRVAEMVGFSSAEQLRRAWKRFEPATPARHRALQGA
jgi:transcriptional regulator GlxA family with amidase domain